MIWYQCDTCNKAFQSRSKKPRCPECNRLCYIRHKPIKPNIKIDYKINKKLLSDKE